MDRDPNFDFLIALISVGVNGPTMGMFGPATCTENYENLLKTRYTEKYQHKYGHIGQGIIDICIFGLPNFEIVCLFCY